MQLDDVFNCKEIIFVCHSMGGLVVRKYMVERTVDLLMRNKKIGLFLIASPALGSDYANWLEPLAKFFGHSQADALRFSDDNTWLMDLDKEFQNLLSGKSLMIRGKELVEDTFVTLRILMKTQVVRPFSGARYFGESYKVPDSDHFSIAKPQSVSAEQYRLLRQFITDSKSSASGYKLSGAPHVSPQHRDFERERIDRLGGKKTSGDKKKPR